MTCSTVSPHGGSENSSVTIDSTRKAWYNDSAFLLGEKHIAKGLSIYGAKTVSEFIAEGWAEFCNSDNPRPIARRIGEIIEREVQR